MVAQTVAQ